MAKTILILLIMFTTNLWAKTLPSTDFKVVKEFINEMSSKHNFNKKELVTIFSQINLQVPVKPSPLKEPEKEKKKVVKRKPMPWSMYRGLFVNESRIKGGITFWKKYHKRSPTVDYIQPAKSPRLIEKENSPRSHCDL